MLESAMAERHKQAVERYHTQCELRNSQIKQAGKQHLSLLPEGHQGVKLDRLNPPLFYSQQLRLT